MSKLNVLIYPDPRLNLKAEKVLSFDQEITTLADDMLETMYGQNGIGLAAIQVNRQVDLFTMDLQEHSKKPIIFINAEIISSEGSQTGKEGCLSFPGIFIDVTRPQYIKVKAQDLSGKDFTLELEDLAARCVHHEMEHLSGNVFIKDLSRLKQNRIIKKIEKYQKQN